MLKFTYRYLNEKLIFDPFSLPSSRTFGVGLGDSFAGIGGIFDDFGFFWGGVGGGSCMHMCIFNIQGFSYNEKSGTVVHIVSGGVFFKESRKCINGINNFCYFLSYFSSLMSIAKNRKIY